MKARDEEPRAGDEEHEARDHPERIPLSREEAVPHEEDGDAEGDHPVGDLSRRMRRVQEVRYRDDGRGEDEDGIDPRIAGTQIQSGGEISGIDGHGRREAEGDSHHYGRRRAKLLVAEAGGVEARGEQGEIAGVTREKQGLRRGDLPIYRAFAGRQVENREPQDFEPHREHPKREKVNFRRNRLAKGIKDEA